MTPQAICFHKSNSCNSKFYGAMLCILLKAILLVVLVTIAVLVAALPLQYHTSRETYIMPGIFS